MEPHYCREVGAGLKAVAVNHGGLTGQEEFVRQALEAAKTLFAAADEIEAGRKEKLKDG